jgi:hypothetical protein
MNIENTKAQMQRCSRVLHLICIKRKRCLHIGNIRHFEKRKIISGGGNHLSAAY